MFAVQLYRRSPRTHNRHLETIYLNVFLKLQQKMSTICKKHEPCRMERNTVLLYTYMYIYLLCTLYIST